MLKSDKEMAVSKSKLDKEWGYGSEVKIEGICSVKWCAKLELITDQDIRKELEL